VSVLTLRHFPPAVGYIASYKGSAAAAAAATTTTTTNNNNNISVPLVRERLIPTERLPLVGEVSANFSG
jgi:hypothetical protein